MMKKVLSIFSSLFILVAGMQLSFDVHHCHGSIAATKLSFTGALATCGMEKEDHAFPVRGITTFDCCQDDLTHLATDKIYMPESYFVKEIKFQVVRVLDLPVVVLNYLVPVTPVQFADTGPPGNPLYSLVRLSDICVFRI